MAETPKVGLLERLQLKNRLEQVTGGADNKAKTETMTQPEADQSGETEGKLTFKQTLEKMQRIANETLAEEKRLAEIAAREAAEKESSIQDTQEYGNVLAMINRHIAAQGNLDGVVPQNVDTNDGVKASPANQAFLEGRGQKR